MKSPQEAIKYKEEFVKEKEYLTEKDFASLIYHDLFDYPLTSAELIRWQPGEKIEAVGLGNILFKHKSGHFYLDGREGIVLRRLMRERSSKKKMKIAKKASLVLSLIPTVKFVGVTGALAMKNADETSDIDLLVITKKDTLWISRAMSLVLLRLFRLPVRRFGQRDEKDKLCLNIWLDETNLVWKKKNIYTAHEIAQIIPLVDKEKTFKKFINKNKWVKDYWPNALKLGRKRRKKVKKDGESKLSSIFSVFESLARKLQFAYMKKKITNETVGKKIALFHPVDWSDYILNKIEGKIKTAS